MSRPADFDYQTYLASREWSLLREQVRTRSKNTCEHCGIAPQQAVHHLTYENLGRESLRDLLAVCNPCHEWLSGKNNTNPLQAVSIVTPAITSASWESLGYSPWHYIIPTGDNALALDVEQRRVRQKLCREKGCIWCGYADVEWWCHMSSLVYQPAWFGMVKHGVD